ncbi:hypothetical protein SUGI_0342180 [Cryptomeria japonica]|uniref:glutathione S-transferase U23-like n=1 Tax=Cryptomeria japonica TaxID=3369 RepID=UPI002408CB30|nr:glutathione S-transferase U23-like [Cryptomeria japonica]GLJ19061.1 hypothetical protein SUGI_0342180 [Cryptomeria japonica]
MASEDEFKVLGLWFSPFALRVLIGLEEKGIKYEYIEEDWMSNHSPLLLEMNPVHKKIPVLIHNGRPVAESAIIVEYIDELWSNGPAFLSSDPYDRALARFWVDFIEKKLIVPGRLILFRSKGEEQEEGKRQFIESLAMLEEALRGKNYMGGNAFGIADIACAPMICWFHTYEIFGDFKIMFEDKFLSIFMWMMKCMERESVKKILPEQEKVLQVVSQARKIILKET